MRVGELKELLSEYEDDFEFYIRNANGALDNNIKVVKIYSNNKDSYLLDSKY
jgi:hypothetical protein